MSTVTFRQTVDIGHGRGRLIPTAAASVRRVDAELKRLGLADYADVNSAWRDPVTQQKLYDAYLAYLRGGPWAPLALKPNESVHCQGRAADSDDWYHAQKAAVWRAGGWRQTARYPSNPKKDEPWHGEHFPHLDELANRPAGGDAVPFPTPKPEPTQQGDIVMRLIFNTEIPDVEDDAPAEKRPRALVGEFTFQRLSKYAARQEAKLWGGFENVSNEEFLAHETRVEARRKAAGLDA